MDLNFSWTIDGKLGGSRGPRSGSDLVSLKHMGVRALVRLVEPHESDLTPDDVRGAGLEDYNEAVRDFRAPTQAQIDRIIEYIDHHLDAGLPVGVSCNAGIGRSGVILACYFVHEGLTPNEALERVRRKRGRGPEVPEQIEAIEDYWRRVNAVTR